MVKVLIKHWRSSGIRIFGFVDDVFGGGRSFNEAQEISVRVRQDLADSGFLKNTEKSVWVPCQRRQHLGYIVDLQKGIFSVTPARIDKFFALLEHISKEKLVSARFIAELIGSIISMFLGVGQECFIGKYRKLFRGIKNSLFQWKQRKKLPSGTVVFTSIMDNLFGHLLPKYLF